MGASMAGASLSITAFFANPERGRKGTHHLREAFGEVENRRLFMRLPVLPVQGGAKLEIDRLNRLDLPMDERWPKMV
jgi:hypothetical protein